MRYAITGATGLLGGNLGAVLLDAGHEVVATRRATSRAEHLAGLPIRWVEAALGDAEALARAFAGCDGVFHCAAAVTIEVAIAPWIRETNVGGTERVIEAVRAAGGPRLVHCSTAVAVGLSTDGQAVDETAVWNLREAGLADAYAITKREAEQGVLRAAGAGADAVVVNPTYMIGPLDARPSSGRLLRDLLLGRVPGYTLGRNNFADARDVARGMLLAMRKGRSGERYILGGRNMTYKAFMDLVSEATGAPRVGRRAPVALVKLIGRAGDLQAWLTGREPLINTAAARWSLCDRFVLSSEKARRELGYQISPLEDAVRAAAAWFRRQGMLD
jgi:dihydroflavonol-4-reductase